MDIAELERRLVALELTLAVKSNLAAERAGIEDLSIPSVSSIMKLAEVQTDFQTEVVCQFTEPEDFPDVEGYEVWLKGLTGTNSSPSKIIDIEGSPARFLVSAKTTGIAVCTMRTRMKGGLKSDLDASPTIAIEITQPSLTAASIADGAITTTKIADAAVTTAKIGTAQITNALIANLAVDNAKINDLAAAKITAGTFAAGVIYANAIEAAQILAGTIVGVNISAGTYSLISGSEQMLIDGTNGFFQQNTSNGRQVQIRNGLISISRTTDSARVDMAPGAINTQSAAGATIFEATAGGFTRLNGFHVYTEQSASPFINPFDGSNCHVYMKADKLIIQYNDGGTIRYKYLDLTGTGVTWVHTTVAP